MALSDMQCRTAKPRDKSYKLYDTGGLYLQVQPTGAKYWRLKYRLRDKEKRIALGVYPEIPLVEARAKRLECKELLRDGFDPVLKRMEQHLTNAYAQNQDFRKIALEWLDKQAGDWTPKYAQLTRYRMEKYIFPLLGAFPVKSIKPLMVLHCLQQIPSPDMQRRMKRTVSQIFKYSIATGRAESDPTYGLECALKKYKRGHFASIAVDEFPEFLRDLMGNTGRASRQTFLATYLLMLTFVRTNELIAAKWPEINFEKAMWIIPGKRMKMGLEHMVPLSHQALAAFKELKEKNGHREYVFVSKSNPRKPMSNMAINVLLKRMGYKGKMCGHGFRSLALGLIKEKLAYSHEVADRQLAHVPKSNVDRAYDRAKFLPQRTEMMQRYSDYIDSVCPIPNKDDPVFRHRK